MDSLLHTPEGVRDIYNEECRIKNSIISKMNRTLKLYGYQEIQTPMFEFFDIFNRERGTVSSKNMYKFIDRDGSTLVLRPDITPSIARAVAKYFNDEQIALRFSYCGNTFINNSSLQGKMKETTQLGAELVGDNSIDADAEIVALVINLLLKSGLIDFQLDIGHVGFFKALAKDAGFNESQTVELRSLIESKNYFAVEDFVSRSNLSESEKEIFTRLPELFGSIDTLKTARTLTDNAEAIASLDYLEKLYEMIVQYGFEKYVTIDLGMLSEYDYYSGIIFHGYTYGTGDAIVKGGRYDHLIGQFGKDAASIGFAVVVDALMAALSRQKINVPNEESSTMVLYHAAYRNQAIQTAASLRAINRCVCMIVKDDSLTLDDYKAYCRRYHMDSILYVSDPSTLAKYDVDNASVKYMPIPD